MKGRSLKKVLLVVTAVLVVLAAGTGAWYYVTTMNKQSKVDVSEDDKRRQELEALFYDATGTTEKAAAFSDLSNHYVAEGDGRKAADYAEKAVEASPTSTSYGQLAFAAQQAGNTEAAIAAYKKAAELARADSEEGDSRSDYEYYMMEARLLEEAQ